MIIKIEDEVPRGGVKGVANDVLWKESHWKSVGLELVVGGFVVGILGVGDNGEEKKNREEKDDFAPHFSRPIR